MNRQREDEIKRAESENCRDKKVQRHRGADTERCRETERRRDREV